MRGGIDPPARWAVDGVDLEALFRRVWPDRDLSGLRVAYVVVVVEGAGRLYIANLALHR